MGIKIHNHYITDGYELSRKEVLKMKVKVRKKPVRKAERADAVRIKVHYNGIKLFGKYYTFGKPEELWKYVGLTVIVKKNDVFDHKGTLLGNINPSLQED